MTVVALVLANSVGETLTIPRFLEEAVARDLVEAGWKVYRQVWG